MLKAARGTLYFSRGSRKARPARRALHCSGGFVFVGPLGIRESSGISLLTINKNCFQSVWRQKSTVLGLTSCTRFGHRNASNFSGASATVDVSREKETVVLQKENIQHDDSNINIILDVDKMMCGGCSASVKRILLKQDKVVEASVNLLTETAIVSLKPMTTEEDIKKIVDSVSNKGFPSRLRIDEGNESSFNQQQITQDKKEERKEKLALRTAWALAVTCYGHHIGHLLHLLGIHEYAHTEIMEWLANPILGGAIGAAAILGPGRELLYDGFVSFKNGNPNMNSLIALGATTSFGAGIVSVMTPGLDIDTSLLEEPVMLLAFVLLGRSLEKKARLEATGDLSSLANLLPAQSRLVREEIDNSGGIDFVSTSLVPTCILRNGDVVQVLPGEKIPSDAEIIQGSCSLDESLMTGESKTVFKKQGDSVIGGTILYDAPILIRITAAGGSSSLSIMAKLVSETQAREAPVQRLADKVAGWFCYGVMSAAALTFVFWKMIGIELFPEILTASAVSNGDPSLISLKLAIDVLVVACPCALGLATPTAVLVSSSHAAKRGLLIRGGDVLEKLAGISAVVFDKTGTITKGEMELKVIDIFKGAEDRAIQLAASAESRTIHPLAAALLKIANDKGIQILDPTSSKTIPGCGVVAKFDEEDVYVGKYEWVIEQTCPFDPSNVSQADTNVWVATQRDGMIARLEFADSIRDSAKDSIKRLKCMGKKVYLLSGDSAVIASKVGEVVGITSDCVFSDKSPKEKAKLVELLRRDGETVMMVGDGINDTIALTSADVGVAMGSGTDAAGSAANVIVFGDNLRQVYEALDIGESTLMKIKQNLWLAVAYNAIGIPLAAGAFLPKYGIMLSPTFAAGMMACSSIVVVTNSLRLKKK